MVRAAVPATDLATIQQTLWAANAHGDAMLFAREVVAVLTKTGAASHPHLQALADGNVLHAPRALADCVHFLAILHGELPSLFTLARDVDAADCGWLIAAADHFERDRKWLARLVVLTGSQLSRHELTMAEEIVREQRRALLTLGRSSRRGCAIGAAAAFATDWTTLRAMIDNVSRRVFGPAAAELPAAMLDDDATGMLRDAARSDASRRAVLFGAAQLASIQGQLADLLEARHRMLGQS
jgi:hypothetical protein